MNDDVTLLVRRKRPTFLGRLGLGLGLGPRDVPYVIIISLCMAVAFMSGRMSAPDPVSRVVTLAISASVPAPMPSAPSVVPVRTAVPLQDLPEDIPPPPSDVLPPPEAPQAPAPAQSVRLQQRPAPPLPPKAVVPEKIELEDEPVIANPYRDRMTSKSPGF